ncbi:hypothetical protein E2C01_008767 [Portunus trituberculatus]|uniref:Uncharacterized protein n=1 Tax=Portunus trituberculatus TaxID=210409 RepID=A0A5B7D1N4_PORTR|nr:hypothetical protein [Portunus trituberculatus]
MGEAVHPSAPMPAYSVCKALTLTESHTVIGTTDGPITPYKHRTFYGPSTSWLEAAQALGALKPSQIPHTTHH